MESFPAYLRIVRKRGPQPFWTPVAPLHRVFSYPLSYVYAALGLTPLAVTLWGLAMSVAGTALLARAPAPEPVFWVGLGLLNLGIIHDACDGEVARYRIHHGRQSVRTYRAGMFADFWAFAILAQAMVPFVMGFAAWRAGAHAGFAVGGALSATVLLSSYVVGFGQRTYWPDPAASVVEESFSFASGGGTLLRVARRAYFTFFETAMFTTHASLVLAAWALVGGTPWWALAYTGAVCAAIGAAFLVSHVVTFRRFDGPGRAGP